MPPPAVSFGALRGYVSRDGLCYACLHQHTCVTSDRLLPENQMVYISGDAFTKPLYLDTPPPPSAVFYRRLLSCYISQKALPRLSTSARLRRLHWRISQKVLPSHTASLGHLLTLPVGASPCRAPATSPSIAKALPIPNIATPTPPPSPPTGELRLCIPWDKPLPRLSTSETPSLPLHVTHR